MKIDLALGNVDNEVFNLCKRVSEYCGEHLCISQYEYDETSNEYYTLGIKLLDIKEADRYDIYLGNSINIKLKNDKVSGYFYQDPLDKDIDKIGISKAGFFIVRVFDKITKRDVYISEPVLVKPAIISIDMYKEMIDMLLNINRDLALQDNSDIYLLGDSQKEDKSQIILDFLNDIESLIYDINNNPNIDLIKTEKKVSYNKIKKFNRKIMIERHMNPSKNKFVSQVTQETENTYENRMIYLSLEEIKMFASRNLHKTINDIRSFERENKLTKEYESEVKESEVKDLREKSRKIQYNLKLLSMQKNNWEQNIEIIEKYLNLKLFKNLKDKINRKEKLKITQIFLHDITYGKYYRKLKLLYENINYNLNEIEDEKLNLKEVYNIFEVWTFYYMIKILVLEQKWEIDSNVDIIKESNDYIRKNKTLYGFSVKLKHKLSNAEATYLKMIYNQTIKLENENLRPDFSFIFKCKEKEKIFYLDAKFHDYSKSKQIFEKDINDTAKKKYYDKLICTEYSPSGSFILHCNNNYKFIDFGGDYSISHKYGSFPITPDEHYYFSTWISMIMEWFYNEYNICWTCGDINPDIEELNTYGSKIKYHLTCKKCGSFWVKNHCAKCSCDKIIKHDLPQKQYHELTKEKWMLKCPKCGYDGITNLKSKTYNTLNDDDVIKSIPIYDDIIEFESIDSYIDNEVIKVIPISKDNSRKVCPRCNGTGYLSIYKHIEGGRCFKCNGTGYIY